MEEKRVEKKVEREETVIREDRPPVGKKVTNVNVGPDGTTNVQETSDVGSLDALSCGRPFRRYPRRAHHGREGLFDQLRRA